VFDGHGGNNCANFLREKLHQYILNDPSFPNKNVEIAIRNGIFRAEKEFLLKSRSEFEINKSGACALCVIFINNVCYFANTGDCRGVISSGKGKSKKTVTEDHKPNSDKESDRIYKAGGQVYRSKTPFNINLNMLDKGSKKNLFNQRMFGPYRVLPGKLSVSRTIGDIYAKDPTLGGNPKVVIPDPDIYTLNLNINDDFIILGSDGIYDL